MATVESIKSGAYKLFLAELHQELRKLQYSVKVEKVSVPEIELAIEVLLSNIRARSESLGEAVSIDDLERELEDFDPEQPVGPILEQPVDAQRWHLQREDQ